MLAATDGSEKCLTSGFAIVAENVVTSVAGGVPGEDQGAFKTEVYALVVLLESAGYHTCAQSAYQGP